MPQVTPDTDTITDERSKALLFALITVPSDEPCYPQFKFAEMLRLWFSKNVSCLAAFLAWLEIRRKS